MHYVYLSNVDVSSQLNHKQESTYTSRSGRCGLETQGRTIWKSLDAKWTERVPQRICGPATTAEWTRTLEDIWGPSSMQVVDTTIAGRVLVQLDRVDQTGLLDAPCHDRDVVAKMGGDRAGKSDAVVEHHVGVVHDDVGSRVWLLNGCKEIKHEINRRAN